MTRDTHENEIIDPPHPPHAVQGCSICHSDKSCILSYLDQCELSVWESLQILKTYQKNETIFWEGEPANGFYLVCKGMVKLSKAHSDGHQLIVRIVTPGNFFGLPPLICKRNHFTSAQAVDKVLIKYVPREQFIEFLSKHPQFTIQMIDHVANELCLARTRLRDFGCKSGRQRLADLLLWLGEEFGRPCPDGVELEVELSRADLAGMAGLTTETTIRLLSALRAEGMIETGKRKRIVLLDIDRLRVEVGNDLLIDQGDVFS